MKERPILFSAPMVRAILAGTKTQTRRVFKVNGQPITSADESIQQWDDGSFHYESANALSGPYPCPYGKPGDRLWVKETIRLWPDQPADDGTGNVVSFYPADGSWTVADAWPWRRPQLNSIHCPRGLSRIDLEITGVRVERLNGISEADAQAEGCPCYVCGGPMDGRSENDCHCFHAKAKPSDFNALWESINGAGSWAANPWVWVVEFRRVEP